MAKTLVILGSGPGIGVHIASHFAVSGFTHIALVSRSAARLAQDEDTVLSAIQERGYTCRVQTWSCDLSDLSELRRTLAEIGGFGRLECVVFNAARVAGCAPLEESTEALERDFRVTNLALYEVFKWAIPVLEVVQEVDRRPSVFVTSTTQLYKEPIPELVSLSMVKSAQRALVLSVNATFGDKVHVALLSVGGVVSPEKQNTSPKAIAGRAWALYSQPKESWAREEEVYE